MRIDYRGTVDATGKEHIGIRVIPGKQPGQEVMLRPGHNTIRVDKWLHVAEHAAVKHMLSTGQLTILEDDSDPKKKGSSFEITKLAPHQAADLIKRTSELEPLQEWLESIDTVHDGDRWKRVREQLLKQIAEVSTDALGNPAKQRPLEMVA